LVHEYGAYFVLGYEAIIWSQIFHSNYEANSTLSQRAYMEQFPDAHMSPCFMFPHETLFEHCVKHSLKHCCDHSSARVTNLIDVCRERESGG